MLALRGIDLMTGTLWGFQHGAWLLLTPETVRQRPTYQALTLAWELLELPGSSLAELAAFAAHALGAAHTLAERLGAAVTREEAPVEAARRAASLVLLKARFARCDFLVDPPPQTFDWFFEHTLFCAIEPKRRDDYMQAMLRWLKPDGQFLGVHYMLREGEGPPYGVTQEELIERFSPHFELKQGWVPRSYANRTGLELMLWWTRKSG